MKNNVTMISNPDKTQLLIDPFTCGKGFSPAIKVTKFHTSPLHNEMDAKVSFENLGMLSVHETQQFKMWLDKAIYFAGVLNQGGYQEEHIMNLIKKGTTE